MSLNSFLGCGGVTLGTLPNNGECILEPAPRLSQVAGVLVLPLGARQPDTWNTAADLIEITDPTVSGNATAKWLIGAGQVGEPQILSATFGRQDRIVTGRVYTLTMDVRPLCDSVYLYMRNLQRNWTGFRFWFYTLGGRLIGGSNGIRPRFTSASFPYTNEDGGAEVGRLVLEWKADGDPDRVLLTGLLDDSAAAVPTPTDATINMQSFPNSATNALTYTENGGQLPTPHAARVWVFQNGQKLLAESGQYTISQGVSSATVTIDSGTHWNGSYYEIFAFETE